MAVAETAKLIASLGFKDNFTPGAKKAMRSLGQLESTGYRVGQQVGKGLNNAATNIKRIGLVAAGGIAVAVHQGIESLADLEDATTSVDAAIRQTGKTGQLTSKQIAGWANEIESSVQAAFDDKEITAAATTLLRYGKVTAANLRPALVVMTDLAAKTGSVDSAASLLAKALAAPEKAAGRLTRSGVILTAQQQKTIKALVKAGKVGQAQKVVLDAVAKSTRGAAAASAGPYRDALNTLNDVGEDATRALAIGFLPVIQKVSKILSTELAKPSTLEGIKAFGTELAGGLDDLLSIAKNLPWSAIGDAFRIAGSGAKAILTAFQSMPPWVQTAILTGWGLNKLTGGALTGIVGELGKGLIKGVLGMNAGVVNIKAGVVTGAGGPGAGSAGGAAGLAGKVAFGAAAIGGPLAVAAVATEVRAGLDNQAAALREQAKAFAATASPAALAKAIAGTREKLNNPLVQANAGGSKGAIVDVLNTLIKEQNRRNAGGTGATSPVATAGRDLNTKVDKVASEVIVGSTWAAKNHDAAVGIGASVDKGASATTGAVDASKYAITGSVAVGSGAVVAAIRANPPPIVNVDVSVTPAQIQKTTTVVNRYGPQQGSAGAAQSKSGRRDPL